MMTSSCEPILEKLSDYAEGELEEADACAVEHHLAGCRPCAGELTLTRALVSGLHRIPEETAPAAVLEAIRRRMPLPEPEPASSWWKLFDLRPWHLASVGFAGALAAAVFFVAPEGRKSVPPETVAPIELASVATLRTAGESLVDGSPVRGDAVPLADGARVVARGPARIAFNDGSTADADDASELVVREGRITLARGAVKLDVAPQEIPFQVLTPAARVTVVGTNFTVRHLTLTSVEVEEGRVQVEALTGGQGVLLGAGDAVEVDGPALRPRAGAPATEPVETENTSLSVGDER